MNYARVTEHKLSALGITVDGCRARRNFVLAESSMDIRAVVKRLSRVLGEPPGFVADKARTPVHVNWGVCNGLLRVRRTADGTELQFFVLAPQQLRTVGTTERPVRLVANGVSLKFKTEHGTRLRFDFEAASGTGVYRTVPVVTEGGRVVATVDLKIGRSRHPVNLCIWGTTSHLHHVHVYGITLAQAITYLMNAI